MDRGWIVVLVNLQSIVEHAQWMTCVREIFHYELFEEIDYVLSSIVVKRFQYIGYTYSSLVFHCLNMILS